MEYGKHIDRLVLGYLKTHSKKAYEIFLKDNFDSEKKYIATRIAGQTLLDILNSYSQIQDIIQGHLEETDYYNDKSPEFSSPMYLVDHLNYLLEGKKSCSCRANVLSQQPENISSIEVPQHQSGTNEVNTSMKCTMPGFSPLSSCHVNNSRFLNENIAAKQTEVNPERNNKSKDTFSRMYDNNIWEQTPNIKTSHNDVAEHPFNSNFCNRAPVCSTPEKSTDNEPDHLNTEEVISEVLSETLLKKVEFQKKLADTINTVLNTPMGNKEMIKNSKSDPNTSAFTGELEETVKTILKKTEEDPMFEEMLDEFLGNPIVRNIDKPEKEVRGDDRPIMNTNCLNVDLNPINPNMNNVDLANVEIIDPNLLNNTNNLYVVPNNWNQHLQLFVLNRPVMLPPTASMVTMHPPSTTNTISSVSQIPLVTPPPLITSNLSSNRSKNLKSSKNLFSTKTERRKLKTKTKCKSMKNPMTTTIELAPSWDASLRKILPAENNLNISDPKPNIENKTTQKKYMEDLGKQLELALETPKKCEQLLHFEEKPETELSLDMKILSPSKLNASKRNLLSTDLQNIDATKIIPSKIKRNINDLIDTPGKNLQEMSFKHISSGDTTPFTPMLKANLKGFSGSDNSFSIDTPDIPITPGYSLQTGNELTPYFLPKESDSEKAVKAMISLEEKKSSVRSTDSNDGNVMTEFEIGNNKKIDNSSIKEDNENVQDGNLKPIESKIDDLNMNLKRCEKDLQDEFFKISGTNLHRNTNATNNNFNSSDSVEKDDNLECRNSQLEICNYTEYEHVIYDDTLSSKPKGKQIPKDDRSLSNKKIVCAVPLEDGSDCLIMISLTKPRTLLDIAEESNINSKENKTYKKRTRSKCDKVENARMHPLLNENNIEKLLTKLHGPT